MITTEIVLMRHYYVKTENGTSEFYSLDIADDESVANLDFT